MDEKQKARNRIQEEGDTNQDSRSREKEQEPGEVAVEQKPWSRSKGLAGSKEHK